MTPRYRFVPRTQEIEQALAFGRSVPWICAKFGCTLDDIADVRSRQEAINAEDQQKPPVVRGGPQAAAGRLR